MSARYARTVCAALAFLLAGSVAHAASLSVSYAYDQLGRVTAALYDNGTCIIYSYDAVGNRTAQTNTQSAGPQTPTWGTGSWGCFHWAALGGAQVNPGGQPESALAALGARDPDVAQIVFDAAAVISVPRGAARGVARSGQ